MVTELLEARRPQAADEVLNTLLPRRDLSETFLIWLDDRCKRANRHDLALRVTGTLLKRAPIEPDFVLRSVRSLHAIGRDPEAAVLLRRAANCSVFAPEAVRALGLAAVECASPGVARELLESAIRSDPAAQDTALFLAYARLLLDARDFRVAKQILRQTYRNPAARDPQPVVDYVRRTGRAPATELRDLELSKEIADEVEGQLKGDPKLQ